MWSFFLVYTWNLKHPFINGCFNRMIPYHCIKKWIKITKHPFKTGSFRVCPWFSCFFSSPGSHPSRLRVTCPAWPPSTSASSMRLKISRTVIPDKVLKLILQAVEKGAGKSWLNQLFFFRKDESNWIMSSISPRNRDENRKDLKPPPREEKV